MNEVDLGAAAGGNISGFDDFSEATQKVVEANGLATCAILSPRTAFTIDRMKDGEGAPLVPPASFAALKRLVSAQIPVTLTHGSASTCSTAFVGDFAALAFGVRTALVIEASRVGDSTAFKNLQIAIRAYLRADVACLRPTWFAKIVGILN